MAWWKAINGDEAEKSWSFGGISFVGVGDDHSRPLGTGVCYWCQDKASMCEQKPSSAS
jgi:hypothetical protein